MKKNAYKVIMEGIASGKISEVDFPSNKRSSSRRLSLEEIKKIVKEEFEDVKDVADVKAVEDNWSDAELEKEVNWSKELDLKEFFVVNKK